MGKARVRGTIFSRTQSYSTGLSEIDDDDDVGKDGAQ
jgi:hypothetical protein